MTVRLIIITLIFGISLALAKAPTDDEIREILIQQSIRSYSGSCPCPYNTTRNAVDVVDGALTQSQAELIHFAMQEMFLMR